MPDLAHLFGACLGLVLTQERIDEHGDHGLAALLLGFQYTRLDGEHVGAARIRALRRLASDLGIDLWGGETLDVVQVAAVPGSYNFV